MDEELKKPQEAELPPEEPQEVPAPEADAPETAAPQEAPDPLQEAQAKLQQEHDQYLRLAAEYDNFRKRSQKEKDNIYRDAKAATVEKFLPVFDNLSRAMEQETADAAYKKGVEMTMTGLIEILNKLDVTIYGQPGDTFSPDLHNAFVGAGLVEKQRCGLPIRGSLWQKRWSPPGSVSGSTQIPTMHLMPPARICAM